MKSVGLFCASLSTPAFNREKSQLSDFKVENIGKIANPYGVSLGWSNINMKFSKEYFKQN